MSSRSEADFLLRILSVSREPFDVSRQPSPDWSEVVDMAADRDLAPLLFKRLKESDARACVPADAWERLLLAYFNSAKKNLRLYRELRPVLRRLRDSGIPVIVLKGAFLAEAVYGDVALRPMCDVDLMVPKAEVPRTQTVLLDMGGVLQQKESFDWAGHHHIPPIFVRGISIEIHMSIGRSTGSLGIDAAGLWDRARPATTAGIEVLALCPEDLLLHLCLHFGHQNRLTTLRVLCDTAETIHHFRSEIDWMQVIDRAREWGATRYVGLTLHMARIMLAAGVPDATLESLVPGGLDPKVLAVASEAVISRTTYDKWLSPAFLGLRGRESLGRKVKRLWERTFLSREAMFAEYPASRNSKHPRVYHARRIWDIVRKWGPALRRMPSHEWERSLTDNALLSDWLEDRVTSSDGRQTKSE
jgi:hypothetical protein